MPTGYTADISKGISFERFALNCARAFGALIMLRDEPAGAEIPEKFEPSPYYAEALNKAREELRRLEGMGVVEAEAAAQVAFAKALESNAQSIAESRELKAKYQAMLAQVEKWQPPSPDHEEMKKFMVQQMVDSIKFDCGDYYEKPENQPVKLAGADWLTQQVKAARRSVGYYEEENAKEIERAASRTKWVKELRASLAVLPVGK